MKIVLGTNLIISSVGFVTCAVGGFVVWHYTWLWLLLVGFVSVSGTSQRFYWLDLTLFTCMGMILYTFFSDSRLMKCFSQWSLNRFSSAFHNFLDKTVIFIHILRWFMISYLFITFDNILSLGFLTFHKHWCEFQLGVFS